MRWTHHAVIRLVTRLGISEEEKEATKEEVIRKIINGEASEVGYCTSQDDSRAYRCVIGRSRIYPIVKAGNIVTVLSEDNIRNWKKVKRGIRWNHKNKQ